MNHRHKAALVVGTLFLLLVSALLHAKENTEMQRDQLPDGEGKTLLMSACGGCHTLEVTLGARKTQEQWRDTVNDMVARGAQTFPDEIDILVEYLTREFGPQTK